MNKKTKKSTKLPEQTISERIRYHKSETKTLRKRIDNLEKRMFELEQRLANYQKGLQEPEVSAFAGYEKKKEKKSFREKFMEEHYPGRNDEDE